MFVEQFLSYSAVYRRARLKVQAARKGKTSWIISQSLDTCVACALLFLLAGDFSRFAMENESHKMSSNLEWLISWLEKVILWIMDNPAGLKLNKPLNHTLGHFFMYHIYLWRTFLSFIGPSLPWLLLLLRCSCVLGVASQMSIVIDLVRVLSIHIYCFHIYAASKDFAPIMSFQQSTSTETPIFETVPADPEHRISVSVSNSPSTTGISSAHSTVGSDTFPRSGLVVRSLSRRESISSGEPVALSWKQLNVYVNDKQEKQILHDLSGVVLPGQLVALMGASGAGKSTLLNTLVGRNIRHMRVDGHVFVNGQTIGRGMTAISAYVQQDDIFIGTLTVREHLIFQALLRLPSFLTFRQKSQRVDEVIFDLGLKKCQHTKIGVPGVLRGISGGEAKRLAFASEVLTNPSLLFCDEPTTGLDSYMAENVVKVLQRLASRGKTILCTIHQPASEIYALFDRVLFLAEGRTAFFGSSSEALNFFEESGYACPTDFNPADYYIHTLAVAPGQETESRERVDAICDAFAASQLNRKLLDLVRESQDTSPESGLKDVSGQSPYKANRLVQFGVLLWRSTLNNYRNPALALVKIVQKGIMGLFVGLLYLDTVLNQQGIMNINGALFYLVNQFIFPSLFGVLNFLPSEFPLSVREHHNGMYTVAAYYISKAISYLPVFTLDGILLLTLAYFMVGFEPTAQAFFMTMFIGILIEQTSVAGGMMFSAVCPSFPVAIAIAGPLLTLLQLSGGLFANVGQFPVYLDWVQYISWFRYGFEALSITQWHSVTNITCTEYAASCMRTGDQVLQSLSFSYVYLGRDILMLVMLMLSFHLIGYLGLLFRTYRAR